MEMAWAWTRKGPMSWLCDLDLPLYGVQQVTYAFCGKIQRQSLLECIRSDFLIQCTSQMIVYREDTHSVLRYPWIYMKSKLDVDTRDCPSQYYLILMNHVSVTFGAHTERIKVGKKSKSRRDTCSYIYHVHEGSGSSEIITSGAETITIHWKRHDTFVVPAWSRIIQKPEAVTDVYHFVLSDRSILEALKIHSVQE